MWIKNDAYPLSMCGIPSQCAHLGSYAVQCSSLTCFQVAQHKLCVGVPVPALHLPAHTLAGLSSASHVQAMSV